MKKLISVLALLFSTGAAASDYSVGQIWKYETRDGEDASRLYIVHIDEDETTGKIYHVYIDGLSVTNPHIKTGIQKSFPHLPVNEKTLDASLTNISGSTTQLPDISEGYDAWKAAFDAGQAGVFDIPVSQIIDHVEKIVNKTI